MLLSKLFIPITKDLPAEAKIKSHQLMLRTGMIRQSSAGIYSWLPLGFKVMKKIEQIVREEQNNIGAQEMLMPTIQSADIWKESGRYDDYGEEMLRISDRQKREMLYGPTNEEQITEIFRSSVKSYKLLPQIFYHIQWKFRDELRPRFGVMRCREFYMKDAYSFDLNDEEANYSYNKFFLAYLKTFKRLNLSAIPMAADTGPIGGNLSHEFVILADTGESQIYTDKRIFEVDYDKTSLDKKSLIKLRKKYENYYSVTDEKYNNIEFEKNVSEGNRLKTKGIEVGHIFYFGTKYSETLGAYVQNNKGEKVAVHMGSYGIGISRLVGAIIEANHDENGIIWPKSVTPFHSSLINLMIKNIDCSKTCENLYQVFLNNNIQILYDDRDVSVGKKFSDSDLLGFPFQIIIGSKNLKDNIVEVKNRKSGIVEKLSLQETVNFVINQFNNII